MTILDKIIAFKKKEIAKIKALLFRQELVKYLEFSKPIQPELVLA